MWESENDETGHILLAHYGHVCTRMTNKAEQTVRLQKCPCTKNITAQLKFRHLIELFLQFIQSFLGLLQSME